MRQIKRGHYKEDEFQSTMENFMKYVVRHKRESIIIGIGALAAIVLIISFTGRGERTDPQADLLHTQAISLMSLGRIQDAETTLRDLTQRYPNTRAGKIGFYYLAVVLYHTNRFNESLEYFDKFLNVAKNDYLLGPSALLGAASAAEAMQDYERALGYYEKVANDTKSPLYEYGVLGYGRVRGLLGETEKAKEILNDLLENDPPADVASEARFFLGFFGQ
jgi:tetratricopeptide (TPR) repeat protein